jgi:exonuclease SbcD
MPASLPSKQTDTIRLLHTSDWHIGKLLNDRSRQLEHERFFDWLIGAVQAESIEAILLAGDVFDTAYPSQVAQKLYYDFCARLFRECDCRFFVVAGNHDSALHLEAPSQVLKALNAHVVGFLPSDLDDRILVLPDPVQPRLAIAALPFLRDRDLRVGRLGESPDEIKAEITAGIRERYRETADALASAYPGLPAIATGHLTVLGASTSDSERDVHIGGLGSVGADAFPDLFGYVALGHLHRPQLVGGDERVRYSGSPIPLSFSEASDTKEVRVVDVSPDGVAQYQLEIPLFRKLVQVRVNSATLEAEIESLDPGGTGLPTWIEVIVEDATFDDDLNERARVAAEGRDFEILRVVRANLAGPVEMTAEGSTADEAIGRLLDEPSSVFDHLLEQHEELAAEDRDLLRTVFAQLLEIDSHADEVAQ